MSTNTQHIHSIGEVSTGEDEDNVFQSISDDSEGIQGNTEPFNNVLTHMPGIKIAISVLMNKELFYSARSESRFSRRFINTVERLGRMEEDLMGFQMESHTVARPPAVAPPPAAPASTETTGEKQ